MRVSGVLIAAAAAALVAGCDGGNTATTSTTTAAAPSFVPCNDIPDDVVAQFADLATEKKDIAGVHQSGIEVCAWDGPAGGRPWYHLAVFSHSKPPAEVKMSPRFVGEQFEPASIAGRAGERNRRASQPEGFPERCAVIFATAYGALTIEASIDALQLEDQRRGKPVKDPCLALDQAVAAMSGNLPN